MANLIQAELVELAKAIIGDRISLRDEDDSRFNPTEITPLNQLRLSVSSLTDEALGKLVKEQAQLFKDELILRDERLNSKT